MEKVKSIVVSYVCDMCHYEEEVPCTSIKEFIFNTSEYDGHRNEDIIKTIHLCKTCQQRIVDFIVHPIDVTQLKNTIKELKDDKETLIYTFTLTEYILDYCAECSTNKYKEIYGETTPYYYDLIKGIKEIFKEQI